MPLSWAMSSTAATTMWLLVSSVGCAGAGRALGTLEPQDRGGQRWLSRPALCTHSAVEVTCRDCVVAGAGHRHGAVQARAVHTRALRGAVHHVRCGFGVSSLARDSGGRCQESGQGQAGARLEGLGAGGLRNAGQRPDTEPALARKHLCGPRCSARSRDGDGNARPTSVEASGGCPAAGERGPGGGAGMAPASAAEVWAGILRSRSHRALGRGGLGGSGEGPGGWRQRTEHPQSSDRETRGGRQQLPWPSASRWWQLRGHLQRRLLGA